MKVAYPVIFTDVDAKILELSQKQMRKESQREQWQMLL